MMNELKNIEKIILQEMSSLSIEMFKAGDELAKVEPKNRKKDGYKSEAYLDALEKYSELSGQNDALHNLLTKIS